MSRLTPFLLTALLAGCTAPLYLPGVTPPPDAAPAAPAPLPVEVVPFGWTHTAGRLRSMGLEPVLRPGPDGDPLKCKMARLHGIFVDTDGAVYIGDSEAHKVRVMRKK